MMRVRSRLWWLRAYLRAALRFSVREAWGLRAVVLEHQMSTPWKATRTGFKLHWLVLLRWATPELEGGPLRRTTFTLRAR